MMNIDFITATVLDGAFAAVEQLGDIGCGIALRVERQRGEHQAEIDIFFLAGIIAVIQSVVSAECAAIGLHIAQNAFVGVEAVGQHTGEMTVPGFHVHSAFCIQCFGKCIFCVIRVAAVEGQFGLDRAGDGVLLLEAGDCFGRINGRLWRTGAE